MLTTDEEIEFEILRLAVKPLLEDRTEIRLRFLKDLRRSTLFTAASSEYCY
jgi:hypothetical protein